MSSTGDLRLERSVFTHPFWLEDRVYSHAEALLDLLQSAAYTDHRKVVLGRLIDIPRGGVAISVRFLERRWGWSNTTVCKFLSILRKEGALTTEKRHGVTIVLLRDAEGLGSSYQLPKRFEKRQGNDDETPAKRRGDGEGETKEERNQGDIPKHPQERMPPTLAQVIQAGETIGCPGEESERFWNHFQAVGWVNRHNQPIECWESRLALWWDDTKRKNTKSYDQQRPTPTTAAAELARAQKRDREYEEPLRPPPILKPHV